MSTPRAADHKGRYGFYAALPLPDIDASLREIDYAFGTLKADGIGMLTSYGDIWLGDDRLRPVFDELNRRGAIVFTHPTDAACCHALANSNPSVVEWFTDTARTIQSMLVEGPAAMAVRPVPAPLRATTRSTSSGRMAAARSSP
jgi:hypothetical protein